MRCSSSGASCGFGMYGSTTTVERGSGPTSLNLMPFPSWCHGRAVACARSSRSRSRALSTLTMSSPSRSPPRACHTNPGDCGTPIQTGSDSAGSGRAPAPRSAGGSRARDHTQLASLAEMKAHHDLVRAADESFVASFRKLAQHVAQGETHGAESIFSFTTGLPLSGFNGCVVTQEASSAELAASLAWVAARAVPFRVWIAENLAAGLAEVPASYGLEPAASLYPGMVLHPIPDAPTSSVGVSVVPIFEPSLDEFIGVLEESGLRAELAHRLISPSFAAETPPASTTSALSRVPDDTGWVARSPGPQSEPDEPGDATPSCSSPR